MFLDDKLFKIGLGGMGFPDFEIESINNEIKENFQELVVLHIFNYYASQNTQKEIDDLEKLMHRAKLYGKVKDQETIIQILTDTIKKYPDLVEELKELQNSVTKPLLMGLLKHNTEQVQIDILMYMLEKKKEIKEHKKVFEEYKKKKEQKNPQ